MLFSTGACEHAEQFVGEDVTSYAGGLGVLSTSYGTGFGGQRAMGVLGRGERDIASFVPILPDPTFMRTT